MLIDCVGDQEVMVKEITCSKSDVMLVVVTEMVAVTEKN